MDVRQFADTMHLAWTKHECIMALKIYRFIAFVFLFLLFQNKNNKRYVATWASIFYVFNMPEMTAFKA